MFLFLIGILQIVLWKTNSDKFQFELSNKEHHEFIRQITEMHLRGLKIKLEAFSERCVFNKDEEGNWETKLHLCPKGNGSPHSIVGSLDSQILKL